MSKCMCWRFSAGTLERTIMFSRGRIPADEPVQLTKVVLERVSLKYVVKKKLPLPVTDKEAFQNYWTARKLLGGNKCFLR